MKPGLICLVRRHQWHSSWDSDEQKTVWTCTRCGRTRVRIGEMDPRRSGWGFWWLTSQKAGRSGEAAQVRDALSARAMELLASWAVRNICPAATFATNPHPPV
jgi:hypothetical protein